MRAQPLISNYSGLVLHCEGEVRWDGKLMEPISGHFPLLRKGSLLEVEKGRVEILMAPGVLLWLGPHSSVRMRSIDLADARIDFLSGSLMMQTAELPAGNAVTVSSKSEEIHAKPRSIYRSNVSPEMERWVRERARVIAVRNAMSRRKHGHRPSGGRPYPSAAPALAGRT